MFEVAVVIVGFRNSDDIAGCLEALKGADADVGFDIFVCENGGEAGMAALQTRLTAPGSPCVPSQQGPPVWPPDSVLQASFHLCGAADRRVHVAQAPDNLGYAGGVNFWLRPLLKVAGWNACWVLNADTAPDPSALTQLRRCSRDRRKGMVGSCLVQMNRPDVVAMRGMRWRKWISTPEAVGRAEPTDVEPDAQLMETTLSAPSGASMYVTRDLIERIGLMEESYFLYYEDLDWGERAQRLGEIGHAHKSVVRHHQGNTIGSSAQRAARSPLSVYLLTRNAIVFVRRNYPRWLFWTIAAQLLHVARYALAGSRDNTLIGLRGLFAGVAGETGRPDPMPTARRSP